MALTDILRDGSGSHDEHPAGDSREPRPLNPLAPNPRSNGSDRSNSRPASFTPLQLGGSSSRSSDSIASSDINQSPGSGPNAVRDIKAEILANWLHNKQEEKVWTYGSPGEGVFMKRAKGSYAFAPQEVYSDGTGLYQAVTELNVRVSRSIFAQRKVLVLITYSVP